MAVPDPPLRRGWTTGACAAAGAKAAFTALAAGNFPDPCAISLPGGARPEFALAVARREGDRAVAGIIKDAGDDPDVTHGALLLASVRLLPAGAGLVFRAGPGVGTVTRPGLPILPGEPAINPGPRRMIAGGISEVAALTGHGGDAEVEISIPGGEEIAERTLNGRLGIVGGLSILGTTGIVVPYSCAAWIHTIHRGIDVARASGITHVAGATGSSSENAVRALHDLPDVALIDMGDFVGGMLKYLRTHSVLRVTVAGGVAKMTKLAQGLLDLHSRRGAANMNVLAEVAEAQGADAALASRIRGANTVAEAFLHASESGVTLGDAVARAAWNTAAAALDQPGTALEVVVFDREGCLMGHAPFRSAQGSLPPRKRRW